MIFACDVTHQSITKSTEGRKSPYELWFGTAHTPDHFRPFGAVGYARRSVREHKMVPRGEKCVFIGIPRNFSSGRVNASLVKARKNVESKAVEWVDEADKNGSNGGGNENLGAKFYTVCHITRDHKARELKFDQHLYVKWMVETFGVAKASKMRASSGVQTSQKQITLEGKEEKVKLPYWATAITRPDIACAVRAVAKFCENLGLAHKNEMLKVM